MYNKLLDINKTIQKNIINLLLLLSIFLPDISSAQQDFEELNVYSARKEALIKPILDKFSQ